MITKLFPYLTWFSTWKTCIGQRLFRYPAAALLLAGLFAGSGADGANPTNGLRIEILSAYNLIVDSNVESPSTYAPRAAYLGARICNDGTNVLTDVVANIGDFDSGGASTPGIYPSRAHLSLVGPLPGNEFALTHEGGELGTADATRFMGNLQPGECVVQYWLISYPNLDENGDSVVGPSIKPDDDLWLEYDVWATADRSGSDITADQTRRVTMRNEISAMANKILPNTSNKVPQEYLDLLQEFAPSWTNLASNGSPGSTIVTEGYWYDFGNIGAGFDNDGDLVPDKNAWMQPVGDADLFDASCFRLSRTYALVVIKLKGGGEYVILAEDQLYFSNIPDNNGGVGYVAYEFEVLRSGCSAQLTPYQEVASGYDNEKFNGDYGASVGGPLVAQTSSVTLAKSVNLATASAGDTLAYTIDVTNPGPVEVGNPGAGLPVVIQDSIPEGSVYIAGSAAASNTLPAGVTSYIIRYSTNDAVTWETVEPAPAASVTDLEWRMSDPFGTGTTGTVQFQVQIDDPYGASSPFLVNTGGVALGSSLPFQTDTAETQILGTNEFGDTVFSDDGTGGGTFGNEIQDGTEPGLTGITVRLYFDANTNGTVDAGDALFSTQVSGASGAYLFTGLPDGQWIASVDASDPLIPTGYTATTDLAFPGDLDSAGATTNGVQFLDADFGFAPALALDKTGPGSLIEGELITYTLALTNRISGNGTGVGQPVSLDLWATTNTADSSGWLAETNAYIPDEPDGLYAFAQFNNNDDDLILTGYTTASQASSITNVSMVAVLDPTGTFRAGDTVAFTLLDDATVVYSETNVATFYPSGEYVVDVTALRAWDWDEFSPTNTLKLEMLASKTGGANPGGEFRVDQLGFRIQTDEVSGGGTPSTTLNPVPLTDLYDADVLQFISASVIPDSISTSGAPPSAEGLITWNNLGPLYAGGSASVDVTFKVLEPQSNTATTITNTAFVTNATYGTGSPANTATDSVVSAVSPAGTIGDFIWRDLNGDGIQDGGNETGISGVSVILTPPPAVDLGNGAGNPVTNTTDDSGFYFFESIPSSGTYTVSVDTATLPGGSGINTWDLDSGLGGDHVSTATVNVASTTGADTELGVDFGYLIGSLIEGTIWDDLDQSATSTPDSGEDLLSGITVYLCTNISPCGAGSALATNVTDVNGDFQFVGSYTGSYVVAVDTNTGPLAAGTWSPTFDTDGIGTLSYATVNVVSGGTARADFSYYQTGAFSIGDTLYYDWDGDGVQDASDEGIPNITVFLYEDEDGDGVIDVGTDAFIGSAVTGPTGQYTFSSLPSTNYLVIVDSTDSDLPAAYSFTGDPTGLLDGRSTLTVAGADRLDQDFGILPAGTGSIGDTVFTDGDCSGTKSSPLELGIASITVDLYIDANGDGSYVLLDTAVTDGAGEYLFEGLADAPYRVIVDTADPDLPMDAFGNVYSASTLTTQDVVLSGNNTDLTADFGFSPAAAIGDTIFFDFNANGTQDANEPGVSNVTVGLYLDQNTNGFFDSGTDSFLTNEVTDVSGNFYFTDLVEGRYVVVVSNDGVLASAVLSADPSSDGVPCSDPLAVNCDGEFGVTLTCGQIFSGADFGYEPPGVLGDTLWYDLNTNGVQDAGEPLLGFITVELYTNGTLVGSTETDAEGLYLFGNLPDGDYSVVIETNDVDFPAGLIQVVDPDGVLDSTVTGIVMSAGSVTSISGTSCTNCSLDIDFAYTYFGTNQLSGTVGLDAEPFDGLLGTGTSGVSSNESPFIGETVYAYLWTDDGNSVVESGEFVLIGITSTTTNGDYSFSSLAEGSVTSQYIVSMSAPLSYLTLTTTNGSTTALSVTNQTDLQGFTISAYQVLTIQPETDNIDFAFTFAEPMDFGDLPASYSTQVQDTPEGPRHLLAAVPDLYLGSGVDNESNGQPTPGADGDGSDEDGVVPVGFWSNGPTGGVLQITVGAGEGINWLVGFMDYNKDGDLTDSGELIISQGVTTNGGNGFGTYTFEIPILSNAISSVAASDLYARFRILPDPPVFPELTYQGFVDNGEVEDYLFSFGAIGDTVWEDANGNGIRDAGEVPFTNVTVYIDLNTNGVVDVGEPVSNTDSNGVYGMGGIPAGTYLLRVESNDVSAIYTPGYDFDGGGDEQAFVTLTAGQVITNADFGYYTNLPISAVGDFVWEDSNLNGIQDGGELGVSNVLVTLYDAATNVITTQTTDGSGNYTFTNLFSATYLVGITPPAGYAVTPKDQLADDTVDGDINQVTLLSDPVAVSGAGTLDVDAGLFNLSGDQCGNAYVVADAGGANGGDDLLSLVDPVSGAELPIGTGLGTFATEAIAFDPFTETLYAADAGNLGTIDVTTGVYSNIGAFGSGDGALGNGWPINDVDGLSMDPFSGILYGAERNSTTNDLLIAIDPATGAIIPDFFGLGVDYVPISVVSNRIDIDDIAIDPYDGQLYGVANSAGFDDLIVKIDKATGTASFLGVMGVNDHEGLGFNNSGQLFGTTGSSEALYDVDKVTGAATNGRPLNIGSDYESADALICDPNQISGTVFFDEDQDAVFNNLDVGETGVTVRLYRDANTNGVVDGADIEVFTQTTDSNGEYVFLFAGTGAFVVDVVTNDLPGTHFLTTDNSEAADFGNSFGLSDTNNNFGYGLNAAISLVKTADGTGDGGTNSILSGADVVYTYEVVNAGSTYLSSITVTDDVLGVIGTITNPVAPGVTNILYATNLNVLADVTNIAVVNGNPTDSGGADLPNLPNVGDTNDAVTVLAAPAVSLIKLADGAAAGTTNTVLSGANVVYTYEVVNIGDTYLNSITVTDDVLGVIGAITNPVAPGVTNILYATNLNVLADVTNIAVVNGNPTDSGGADLPNLPNVGDTNDAVTVLAAPAVNLIKLADSAADGTTNRVYPGSSVVYSYEVVNAGDTYLNSITVTDDVLGVVGTISGPVAPGETNVLTATNLNVTADVTNIGVVDANPTDSSGTDLPNLANIGDTDDAITELLPFLSVGDTVWLDLNEDGIQDGGLEVGVSNIVVTLYDASTNVLDTQITDASGAYLFTNLVDGTYVVGVAPPGGFALTLQDQGGDETADSDVNPVTQLTAPIVLGGADTLDIDAGIFNFTGDACGNAYVVADAEAAEDQLSLVNPVTGLETPIGSGLTVSNVEAIAFSPFNNVLYAMNGVDLGAIDVTTGVYSNIGSITLLADGALGSRLIDDVDGLSVDPFTGVLYGTERNTTTNDLLIAIHPATGLIIPDFFGTGLDYQPITIISNRLQVDDIAIDPIDGQMYAIQNNGPSDDILVSIDKTTGVAQYIGALGVVDHEGLGFNNLGELFGTTGGGSSDLYDVNKATGAASNPRPLSASTDYEAADALICDPNQISGTVFFDENTDAAFNGSDVGETNVTVNLYRDANTNGVVDAGDVLLTTQTTDSNGDYTFTFAATGAFVVDISTNDLPGTHFLTTDNVEAADFGTSFGLSDVDNDFGYGLDAAVTLIKLAGTTPDGGTNIVVTGADVVYSYVVVNAGSTYLSSITVTDDVLGVIGSITGPVAPGATNFLFATHSNVMADVTNIGVVDANPVDSGGNDLTNVVNVVAVDDAVTLVSAPDYELVKTVFSPAGRAADVGEPVVFNIVITNSGDVVLSTVPVQDLYDTGILDFVSAVPATVDTVDDGTINWTDVGPLPVGASTTLVVNFTASSSTTGASETNTVVASPTTPPAEPPVPPKTNDVPYLVSNPDYDVVKTVFSPSGRAADLGETVVFNIVVTNSGDVVLSTVPVSDLYNTNVLSFVSALPATDDGVDDGLLNWADVGPLPVGASTTLVVNFTAAASTAGSAETNTVVASPTTPPTEPPVPPKTNDVPYLVSNPDYDVVKTVFSPTGRAAEVGETVVFNIVVTNSGDVVLSTVPVSDLYDTNILSFVSALPAADDLVDDGLLNWTDVGPLPVGASTTLAVNFTAAASTAGSSETNTVVASPTTPPTEPPVPPKTNDVPYLVSNPDYDVVKTVFSPSGRAADLGETVVFNIVVTNSGDVVLSTVPVSDLYDTNVLSFVSAVPATVDALNDGAINWTDVGPLPVGASTTLVVNFTAAASTAGSSETNTVVASPTTPPTEPPVPPKTNDVPYLVSNPDYDVVKTVFSPSGRAADLGETVVFNIVVTNSGDVVLSTVPVSDLYDTNILSFVSALPAADDLVDDGLLNWTDVGPLPVGASTTLVVNFTAVASTIGGSATNTVVANPTTPPTEPPVPPRTNDVPYDVSNPDFEVTKTLVSPTNGVAILGQTMIFDVVITNSGNVPFIEVPITDNFYLTNLLSFSTATPTPDSVSSNIITWTNIGPLAVGGTATVSVEFTAIDVTLISQANDVFVSPVTPTNQPSVTQKTDRALFLILPPGGFDLTKSVVSPAGRAAQVGEPVVFDLAVANTGGVTLADVALNDLFDTNYLSFVSAVPPQDSVSGGLISWTNIGSVATNSTTNVTVTFTALTSSTGAPLTNVVIGSVATPPLYPFIPPKTNEAPYAISRAGYDLVKTLLSPTNRPPIIGEPISFLVTVSNTGDVNLVTVPVVDDYDLSLISFVSAVPASDDLLDDGMITWTDVGPLPVGSSTSIVVNFTAASATAPLGTNTAVTTPTTPPTEPPVPPKTNEVPYDVDAPATVGDFVFEDLDGDGIQGGSEPGITNVTVTLYDAATNLIGATATDSLGGYSFTNLVPGSYFVEFTPPAGLAITLQGQGADPALDSDADPATGRTATLPLVSGETNATLDAGLYVPSELGDFVWNDLNADGIQDGGETGVVNVAVELFDAASNSVDTTTTDASGFYQFTNLPPQDYFVVVTPPAGYSVSPQDQGGDDTADSDIDVTLFNTAVTNVLSGTTNQTLDAGLYLPASLGDFVWVDTDGDGTQNGAETNNGIVGVTVTIYDASTNALTNTTTDINGFYAFSNLVPNTYLIGFTPPVGYEITLQGQGGDPALDSDADQATGLTAPVTLVSGENNLAADAGFYIPAVLGDFIWEDINANGIQDAEDLTNGLFGIAVDLRDAASNLVDTVTTDASGFYQFTNLAPAAYFVDVNLGTLPSPNYLVSPQDLGGDDAADSDIDPVFGNTAITNISSGETNLTLDAGVYQSATIGDFVFEDQDGDGVQGGSEPGITNVTVTLYDPATNVIATTTTDSLGGYSFTNVVPGSYFVGFTPPAGMTFTTPDLGGDETLDSDADPVTGYGPVFTINSGETDDSQDAGLYFPATLGDYIWDDFDADGIQDAEDLTNGLAGITVELYDTQTNLVDSTVTGPAGDYTFTNLAPNTYFLDVDVPAGFIVSPQNQGGDEAADSDVDAATGISDLVTLSSGETNLTVDGGIFQPVTIGNFVFEDQNGDGIQTGGEPGVTNVTVTLYDAATNVLDTTTTDGLGGYSFTNVLPGTYFVGFTPPAGTTFTAPDQGGDDTLDSDADPVTGFGAPFTLLSGETDDSQDAGLYYPATLGDYIWDDINANGLQDAADLTNGLSGITVELYDSTTNLIDTATTDPTGFYIFTNLAPNTYFLDVDVPAGFTVSPQNAGGDTVDSDIDTTNGISDLVTLSSAETNLTVDGGVYQPVTIGDFVFEDQDGDGVQDGSEPGITNVTVTLYGPATNVIATTVTDSLGGYSFTNVMPGSYFVGFTPPAGMTFTTPDLGGNDALDSDADPVTGYGPVFTINSGEADSSQDAGLYFPATLGDYIWDDFDADGIQDAEDLTNGLAGVTVELYDTQTNLVDTTVTGPAGDYTFTNLPPADYFVLVIPPANGTASPQDAGGDDALDSDFDETTFATDPVTVSSGETNSSVDGAFFFPATLGDRVWFDENADGVQDAGETNGIEGVVVTLLDAGLTPVTATVTDMNGNYAFTNLAPGVYSVEVTAPFEFVFSPQDAAADALDSDVDATTGVSDPVTLVSGENNADLDAGVYQVGSLAGTVFHDENDDGVDQLAETTFANVSIQLFDAGPDMLAGGGDDVLVDTTVTDINGNYLFTDLIPGTYFVDVIDSTVPAGFGLAGSFTDPGVPTPVNSGQDVTDVDIGYLNPNPGTGIIGDYVWIDTNGDGIQDASEIGVSGVEVTLWDVGPDGIFGTADDVAEATDTTDLSGHYYFPAVPVGTFVVEVTDTAGTPIAGFTGISGPQSYLGNTTPINIAGGEVVLDADFGYTGAPLGSIGDSVFIDSNGNGTQDGTEAGIVGVTVNLTDGSGTILATQTTGSDGAYLFNGLPAGSYEVDVTDLSGVLTSYTLTSGTPNTDGESQTDPYPVTVTPGLNVNYADFGYQPPAGSIGNQVFIDSDGDGIFDPGAGDVGLGGVTVQLFDSMTNLITTVVTEPGGTYIFGGLVPGSYLIAVDPASVPPALTVGPLGAPGLDNNSQAQLYPVVLAPGESDVAADFGYASVGTVSIGDSVYYDWDSSGAQDTVTETNSGVPNITLELYIDVNSDTILDGGDILIATDVTDTNGMYLFTGLAPTNYVINLLDPNNLLDDTAQTEGTLPQPIDITDGLDDFDVDLGFVPIAPLGAIGDTVWIDLGSGGTPLDGLPNENLLSAGLNHVTVNLLDTSSNLLQSAVTTNGPGGQRGYYLFNNLAFGEYLVEVDFSTVPGPVQFNTTPLIVPAVVTPTAAFALADFGFRPSNPTAVELTDFSTVVDGDHIRVQWSTALELGTLGFRVLRAESLDGDRTVITPSIIYGEGSEGGASYDWLDTEVQAGVVYFYWLEEEEVSGNRILYGPVAGSLDTTEQGETLGSFSVAQPGVYRIGYEVLLGAGIPANQLDLDQIQVWVNSTQVAAMIAAADENLQPGDYILFYSRFSVANVEIRLGDESLRMDWVYVRPTLRTGNVYVGAVFDGSVGIPFDPEVARHLIVGFTEYPVWLLDISNADHPAFLYGFRALEVDGEISVYFDLQTDEPGEGTAVDGTGILNIEEIDSE